MLPVYVIANGDLVKATFDAIAIVLNSETFNTAIKLATTFAILGVGFSYIRGRDLAVFFKWFLLYFLVTVILLGPKKDLQIIDSSNPMAVYKVDNLPLGLALPASLITRTAHGLMIALEDAYHLPDELTYNKTGMLFGSRLFKLSTGFQFSSPQLMHEFNHYVKNCVLGDISINKKYSLDELKNSNELLILITSDPSPRRGVILSEGFKTCKEAAPLLKEQIKQEVEKQSTILGLRIFGNQNEFEVTAKLKTALANTYQYYAGVSNSALQIMTQNILINGLREGILNYASETQASAAFLNLSTTQAMERMRLSWATSRNMAAYVLPVMHTDILLMLFCLFPVIVMLSIQPQVGPRVLKNYFYSILWVESWPILFACLNLTVSFYAQGKTSALGKGGLTLSNLDLLALEHSDIANLAGYLMLTIPFIAIGLVTGMAHAFSSAAAYIGGVLQSSAIQASSEAASGNISLGIASWGNVNANKFDTNSTLMRGHATEQLSSGVLRTARPDGETTYDALHATSKLPTQVRSSDLLSSSFSEQAEVARTAAIQDQKTYDEHLSHAISDFSSLGKTLSSGKSMTENFGKREAVSAGESFSNMKNIAENIAKRNNVEADEVFKGMVNFSQNGKLNAGLTGSISINPTTKLAGEAGLGVTIGSEHVRSNESQTRHGINRSIDITAEEAQRFSKDLHQVEEYSKSSHVDSNHSLAASQLAQLSTDLRHARSASEQYSVHKAESERLSSAASYIRQHSSQIDSDLGQEIADYAVSRVGREEAERLFAGKDRFQLESMSKEYIRASGTENSIISQYQKDSADISPEQKYHNGAAVVDAKANRINLEHETYKDQIDMETKTGGLGVDEQKFNQVKDAVENRRNTIDNDFKAGEEKQNKRYKNMHDEIAQNIKDGSEKSKSSAFSVGNSILPDYAKSDANKK